MTTIVSSGAGLWNPQGIALDSVGNIYVTDSAAILKITSEGVVSTLAYPAGG